MGAPSPYKYRSRAAVEEAIDLAKDDKDTPWTSQPHGTERMPRWGSAMPEHGDEEETSDREEETKAKKTPA